MDTWRDILDLGLAGCGVGGSPDAKAAQKWDVFMTEANRRLHDKLTVSECYRRIAIPVTVNQDWIPQPSLCHSIKQAQNRTGGHKLTKEPAGSLGRMRFFAAGTDAPPKGNIESVNFYWREGGKIWLRDTPNEAGFLDFEYKFIPAPLTKDDLDLAPALTEQFYVSIAEMFVAVYYQFHPPPGPDGAPIMGYGAQRAAAVFAQIEGQKTDPSVEEDLDNEGRILYQPGYEMGGVR